MTGPKATFVNQIQNLWTFRFEILDMDLGLDNNPTEVNYGWKMILINCRLVSAIAM